MSILLVDCVVWGPDHLGKDYPMDVGGWIADAFDGDASRFEYWRIRRDPTPPVALPEAVAVSGSAASAYDADEWIAVLANEIRRWAEARVPVLGICFGHQIVAQALGGRVEKNPAGWEAGTYEIELTDAGAADPLFEGFPRRFLANESHQDHVVEPPPGAVVLARSERCGCQSMAIGDSIRTVQFHPEYTDSHLRFLLEPRRDMLKRAGLADADDRIAAIGCDARCPEIVRNFERRYVAAARSATERRRR